MTRSTLMTTLLTLATAATAVPTFAACHGGHHCPTTPTYHGHQPVYHTAPAPFVHRAPAPIVHAAPAAVRKVSTQASAASREAALVAALRSKVAAAKAAFAARNYGTALQQLDAVLKATPKNNEALQFRSMVHFALGDYKAAAADAYEAMKYGNVWNATAITALYGDVARYKRDLADLRDAATERQDALELRFLLAYHSLLNGDLKSGESELEAVLKIRPAEPMAEKLLAIVRSARAKQEQTVAADQR